MEVFKPSPQLISPEICDIFISVGLSRGIAYEEEFMKNNPKLFGFLIDKIEKPLSIQNKKLVHINQALSTSKTPSTENLHNFFNAFKLIYLKMNVKGYEIEYFKSLILEQIGKIKILDIELHADTNLTIPNLLYPTHILSSISQPNKKINVFKCIFVKGSRNLIKPSQPIIPEPIILNPPQPIILHPPPSKEIPHMLTVYSSPFPKIRLGRDYDGGYVIADIPDIKYSLLVSAGIEDDISFEEDFIKKYKSLCYAFDGTIEALPYNNSSINFIPMNIGSKDDLKETNLHKLIENNNNLFVKIDIEGSEVPWIESLHTSHLDKIEQLAIEFHQSSINKNTDIFNILNKTHVLIHLHPNNCLGLRNHNGVMIPYIFECTYIHKRHFSSAPTLNKDPIPGKLDMRNVETNKEIFMNFPPYVN